MHGITRVSMTAGLATLAFALAACGGLGINLRGGNENSPTQVAITATSGTTVNPYPVEIGHTTTLVAHPSAGNVVNYSVVQPVRWDSSIPTSVVLLEPDCNPAHPYAGEFSTTVCVFGAAKAIANVDGTTSNGAVGTLAVSVII